MNALGDRCRSVVVLANTQGFSHAVLDPSCGYHVGCVLPSPSPERVLSATSVGDCAEAFLRANNVAYAREALTADQVKHCVEAAQSVTAYLSKPVTILDATSVTSREDLMSLLLWLYGAPVHATTPASSEAPPAEAKYTLVAVVDVSRGAPCTTSHAGAAESQGAGLSSWLVPTPSYYSELMEEEASKQPPGGAAAAAPHCCVFPVQMYSRYPVVRDRGLQESGQEEAGAAVPVAQWRNKSTFTALLRELAFKAGQLAKYGA